jgi:AraC-like DNA-binding protein
MRRRELPGRHITVILSFGDPLVLIGGDGHHRRVGSFVSGLQSEPAIAERVGHQYGMHLELSPLTAYSLFGVPMHSLANTLVELPAMLGNAGVELVERLAAARGWPERFALLQAALAERVTGGPQPTCAISAAWHRLRATHGTVRIDELARQSGISHRHLVARFREEVGLTPKSLARVLRFEHSLSMLRQRGMALADIANAAGYYDQAHLNRDYQALAGATPGALLADVAPAVSSPSGQISPRPTS